MNNKLKETILSIIIFIASFILGYISPYISNLLAILCAILLVIGVVYLVILKNDGGNKKYKTRNLSEYFNETIETLKEEIENEE